MAKQQPKPQPKQQTLPAVQKIGGALALPEHLKGRAIVGVEELNKYVVLPRIKVVQKQAADQLLQQFNIGDVVITPTFSLVCPYTNTDKSPGDPWYFTPLYFFANWAVWSPISLRGQVPMILEETSDPESEIARRARSKNKDDRFVDMDKEGFPRERKRYVEQLNYVITLQRHDLADMPMMLTCSKGEHFSGSKMSNLVQARKSSIFACVFQANVVYRPGQNNLDWYGIDFSNPADESVDPWVAAEHIERFEEEHNRYAELYSSGRLKGDETQGLGDEETPGDTSAPPAATGGKVRPRF
jgi:hypothetical protein